MLITTTNKELPDCPFIYDQRLLTVYPVICSEKIDDDISHKFCNILQKHINCTSITSDQIEYYVNIQFIDDAEKEIYVSFHTWLILALNSNIKIIPNGINISSNFFAGLYPIHATIVEAYEENIEHIKMCNTYRSIRQGVGINCLTSEYAKITTSNKKLEILPANSCNFILKSDDYPINTFFSVIQNPSIYITENKNYVTHTKQIKKTAITLHVAIPKSNADNINEIIRYINDKFGLKIVVPFY